MKYGAIKPSDLSLSDDSDAPELESSRKRRKGPDDSPSYANSDSDVDSHSEEEEPSEDEQELAVREEIADIPFEVLQAAKANNIAGLRKSSAAKVREKRANKNRPMEVSSSRPVPRLREIIQVPKAVSRDPRFDSLCGELDESRFRDGYSFLYEETLPKERQALVRSLKKEKDGERKRELREQLRNVDSQLKSASSQDKSREKMAEMKRVQKSAVVAGKKPFFLKKSELRRQALVEKYKELKAAGKLDSFLAKRRQRNAAGQHTKIPRK